MIGLMIEKKRNSKSVMLTRPAGHEAKAEAEAKKSEAEEPKE